MDCVFLLLWTLAIPLLSRNSVKVLSALWFGDVFKTFQICCCYSDFSTAFGSQRSEVNDDMVFVIPSEVDSNGAFISHDILGSSRKRRSLPHRHNLTVHYKLSAFGKELLLDLKPSNVIANGFTIQTLGRDGVTTLQEPRFENCFYQGLIRNHSISSAAISTCTGLSGLIRIQDDEFLITPLPQHLAKKHSITSQPGQHTHVLYKRSAEAIVQDKSLHGIPHYHHQSNLYKKKKQHGMYQMDHFCGRHKKYYPKPPIERLNQEYEQMNRPKRSPFSSVKPGGLNVETLVVADQKMLEKHGKENVTTYVLTVMNMVSSLFKDGTIGTDINIVVVSLLLLEQDPVGLVVNHHADQSLNSFCQWQSGLSGKNGKRHDHALLLTGLDICSWKNEPCDTLGFAPISGMCNKYRSCTINEDTGLGLAFTIAHESGHNFGMVHDGEGNACRKAEGNIMSPTLAGNNGVFFWSACSRQYLNKFLSTAQASCLIDEPKQIGKYTFPDKLPGQLYDADMQCKWQFGSKAKLCNLDFVKDICKSLWCHRSGHRCETKFMPAAEGTLCGHNMWCRRGQCVKFGDHGPKAVHGQWSQWSEWSDCSRTCGTGVMYRERLCNNPKPQYGGKFCIGSSRLYQLCNTKACKNNIEDFRAQQCAEYNSKPFRGWYYKWKPYTKVEEEDICKLYCIAENYQFFFAMSNKVKDGTPCSESQLDVCIEGICEQVGCDHVLGSKAELDACGVCNGSNSTCAFFRGQYLQQHSANEYYSVIVIPAGARSIHIHEMEVSTSYLAVRNLKKKYYLTGNWIVDWPGKFSFAGTVFDYQRPVHQPETLFASGPTNESLVFEVLLQGKNPGIAWEYTLPKNDNKNTNKKDNYTWVVIRSNCSASCAGGQISTKAVCLQNNRIQVNSSFCSSHVRPTFRTRVCNTQPCPAYWYTGEWSTCSQSCGGGQQSRQVQCMRRVAFQREEVVAHSLCSASMPAKLQTCNNQACQPEWISGAWSQCSKTCGRGVRVREVYCTNSNPSAKGKGLPDSLCNQDQKPKSQETCVLRRCPRNDKLQWMTSAWSECSITCGPGIEKRELKCCEKDANGKITEFPVRRCRNLPKPAVDLQQACNKGECEEPNSSNGRTLNNVGWYSSPWQQCTVSCGGGVQTRHVQCLRQGRPSSRCLSHLQPITSRACNTNFCPAPKRKEEILCKDIFSWCHLVPQHGVCNHKFYGQQCCKSCAQVKQ
ncbi:LOW QUALITY PROTEIN: A disintegrin and metalloproteinase with thrombospondin motifs 18 [Polypterus senegalus]|uniref:LOW QUALITY PROTEIN: A disintegrin and metalloproteinase with thrombospondin motifs 18 n=1 Tax=Polypterus senegalus TaxID=55291 RepID=UPI0019629BAA|nr:LOW QUALITY PROTEIN: A disintegrin and metalloproteinase with thrombospondin motifs 18 [Polypterus senegalus]